ncbi:MAG: DegV family protein [Ilumatobacteraceae bacterium]|jgi:hypothetical protein
MGSIGLCTDSGALLPSELVSLLGVTVVPATVQVGEHEYLAGVDLDHDTLIDLLATGREPISIVDPSAGQFALAYEHLAAAGCTEIVSVHASSKASATINAARLAAHRSEVPVRIVECDTTGFGVSGCLWAVADVLAAEGTIDEAVAAAESVAGAVIALRLTDDTAELTTQVAALGRPVRVGLGVGPRSLLHVADAYESVLAADPMVETVVRYRLTPTFDDHGHVCGSGIECITFPAAPGSSTPAAS